MVENKIYRFLMILIFDIKFWLKVIVQFYFNDYFLCEVIVRQGQWERIILYIGFVMDYFIEDMVKYIGKFLFCILIDGKKKYGKDMMVVILLFIICYLKINKIQMVVV